LEKVCTAGQATDGNMAHALCIMGNLKLQTHSEYVICIACPRSQ